MVVWGQKMHKEEGLCVCVIALSSPFGAFDDVRMDAGLLDMSSAVVAAAVVYVCVFVSL